MGCMLIFVYHHGHFHLHCFAFMNNDALTYSVQHKAANILILRIDLNQIKRQSFSSVIGQPQLPRQAGLTR